MSSNTQFAAMKAQAAFENCKGDKHQALFDWLCAEVAHANESGIDFVVAPSRPIETEVQYDSCFFFAWQLAKWRTTPGSTVSQVA